MEQNNDWMPGAEDLWLAVIVQAVKDLHDHRSPTGSLRGRLSISSTREWVQSPEGGIGSLAWICDALGLDIEWVQRLALEIVVPGPLHPQNERNFAR